MYSKKKPSEKSTSQEKGYLKRGAGDSCCDWDNINQPLNLFFDRGKRREGVWEEKKTFPTGNGNFASKLGGYDGKKGDLISLGREAWLKGKEKEK